MPLLQAHVQYARYTVLRLIHEGANSQQVAEFLHINPSNARRRIYVLERQGFLVKGGRSAQRIWRLTGKGMGFVEGLRMVFGNARRQSPFPQRLRRHQVIVRFERTRDFSNREKNLALVGFIQKNRGFKNMQGFELKRRGVKIFWNGRSLLLFPEEYYGWSVPEILSKGLEVADEAATWFTLNTGIELEKRMETVRQQIALEGGVSNLIPDKAHRDDYLLVDASKGTVELETIDRRLAPEHMMALMIHFNKIIREAGEL